MPSKAIHETMDEWKHEREKEWKCNEAIIQELINLSASGDFEDYTKFIYRFIAYNTLYSYLKNDLEEHFSENTNAVGKSISKIKKDSIDSHLAATLLPCYLGHGKMEKLLREDLYDEINQFIRSIHTEEQPDGEFRIFLTPKKPKDFWQGRACKDSEYVELIKSYLGGQYIPSNKLKEKLTKTDGKITDAIFCESILILIYQVRCNLFHGSKKSGKQSMILKPMHEIVAFLVQHTVQEINLKHRSAN
jgi:hypothetical protein